MALHTALLNEQSRELVPARMQYPVEPSGLLGTSKIMQYKSPDFGQTFSGESGNNVMRFTLNGPGLLDPRSLYLRWSWKNISDKHFKHCDPGSYSPIKRVRILSGFNQQILYDLDGYNVFCAFLDDYQKSIHDFATDTHGFYALRTSPEYSADAKFGNQRVPSVSTSYVVTKANNNPSKDRVGSGTAAVPPVLEATATGLNQLHPQSEFLQWEFRPKFSVSNSADGELWRCQEKLFSICDLPHIGFFTQGKYIPLWGLGGLILELYVDTAQNWCTVDGTAAPTTQQQVEISDVELYYDNIVPPAKFLETMREVIDSPEGLSFVFPSVNRHLNSLSAVPAATNSRKTELLVPDHSRMAQAIFQVMRPQSGIAAWNRVYKLHNRTPGGLLSWQAKLNSQYLPQQPLRANLQGGAAIGATGSRRYLQFHKELMKALGQQRRSVGSVTPAVYELDSSSNLAGPDDDVKPTDGSDMSAYGRVGKAYSTAMDAGGVLANAQRGAFAVGIDLTVSDDVITGTNLRNATVTGEMFINIEQTNPAPAGISLAEAKAVNASATAGVAGNPVEYPALEVQTYIMKLSQIRLTSAGPVLVD